VRDDIPKVWIESALNGAWGRDRQPAIPISVEEIVADGVAAAKAGAAIIHLHAYDAVTGRQRDTYEIYAPIIEGIRAQVDAIVYPTLPISGADLAEERLGARERYEHVERLAKNGLLEWAVIDPGSAVFTRFDQIARGEAGTTYLNPDDHFLEGMRIAAQYGVRPSYAIYEAGCARLGAATAAAMPKVPVPVYRFMFATEFSAQRQLSRNLPRPARRVGPGRALDGCRPRPRYPAADCTCRRTRRPYSRRARGSPVGRARDQSRPGRGGGAARAGCGRPTCFASRGPSGLCGCRCCAQTRHLVDGLAGASRNLGQPVGRIR